MTRPWGRLLASTLTHRKYLRSTHEDRSAWLTLLLASFNSPSDDDLGCRADVEATLRALGHRHPAAEVDRLVELGWLDERETGFFLHDWQEHQPSDPTGAKRKARQRDGSWSRDSHGTVTGQSRDTLSGRHAMSHARGEESREEENLEGALTRVKSLAPARARAGDDTDPAFPLRQWLAAHNAPVRDGDGYHAKLVRMVASDSGKTCGDVLVAFERLRAEGARTSKQFVMGAEDALFPTIKTGSANGKTTRSLSDTDFDAGMVGADADWFERPKA